MRLGIVGFGVLAMLFAACGDGEGSSADADGDCSETGWQQIDTGDWQVSITGIAANAPDDVYLASSVWMGHLVGTDLDILPVPILYGGDRPMTVGSAGTDGVVVAGPRVGDVARYDGATWEILRTELEQLQEVWARAADDVFVVGMSATHPILHYDGASWSSMTPTGSDVEWQWRLYDVWGRADAVYAVGSKGVPNGDWSYDYQGVVLEYKDGIWSETDVGDLPMMGYQATAVTGADSGDLWVGGTNFLYHFDGATWSAIDLNGTGWDHLDFNAIWTAGPDLYARADAWQDEWEEGWEELFLNFDGVEWTELNWSPTDMDGTVPDDVYAVGYWDGVNVKRFDGSSWLDFAGSETFGEYFTPVEIELDGEGGMTVAGRGYDSETEEQPWVVWEYDGEIWTNSIAEVVPWSYESPFIPPNGYVDGTFWFAGGLNEIWSLDDAGWTLSREPNPCPGANAIWSAAEDDIFAACNGGTVLRYEGAEWTAMETGTDYDLIDIWGNGPDDVYAIGWRIDGYYELEGTDLYHFDGVDWSEVDLPSDYEVTSVWGTRADNVFVAGFDPDLVFTYEDWRVMLHFDGASWNAEPISDEPCNGYGDEPFVTDMWGVEAGDVTELYLITPLCSSGYDATNTNAGTILKYDGASWERVQVTESIDFDVAFHAVAGTGPDDVWLAGDDGILLHYPCE